MPVFALWSAPRARSTAFFRSMVERGDMVAVHEPFCDLAGLGETDVEGRPFHSPLALVAWLRDQTHDINVFLKDTPDHRHHELLADRRFLAAARHAFLIRRPEEIAASFYAVEPGMTIDSIGLEWLHELHTAVCDAAGHRPVVIDSDDLVARPAATMAAYCAAVELPFIPEALTWEPASDRSGAGPHAGTSRSVPARASLHPNAATPTPSRTPTSWPTSPPITGRSTSSSTPSGSTPQHGSRSLAPDSRRPPDDEQRHVPALGRVL
jgi:hypothetical protein